MPTIHQLPQNVINKIAAGEVIERPASVVKELMENSVDAGATRIEVQLQKGGTQLIRIADNGCGIQPEQLLLAVASHATSKIHDADDLFHVATLGFRGEALASIASVSQFFLRSRADGRPEGAELEVHGGTETEVVPCGAPPGTVIEVRNLFFNTPVRRKFLRTVQTELGHASEAFIRIALANPQVHCMLRHGDRMLYDLPAVENWRERILALFPDLGDALISVQSVDGEIRIDGYVADPSHNRANGRMQYLFLNKRHIRDRALQHALGEAYRGLLLTGRYPITFLRLSIPPETVDVNVHPSKLEVRFQDGGAIYSRLLAALRNRFLRTDLTAQVQTPGVAPTTAPGDAAPQQASTPMAASGAVRSGSAPPPPPVMAAGGPAPFPAGPTRGTPAAMDPSQLQQHDHQLRAWARGDRSAGDVAASPRSDPARHSDVADAPRQSELPMTSAPPDAPLPRGTAPAGPAAQESASRHGIQIHNRYLVAQVDQGMVVIDQHALHERILYEQLRPKVLDGSLETQRLLVPEPVPLTPREASVVMDAKSELRSLGVHVEPFGGDTVLVTAYPAMLSKIGPAEVLRNAVELLMSEGNSIDRRQMVDSLLHMMSCRAAVKAGDRLSPEEITALLEQRDLCQDAHHCPHGRPTALVFTRDELDRMFLRT